MPRQDKNRGSAAWIVASKRTTNRIRGALPSTSQTANAYRSELTGLYAVLLITLAVCKVAGLEEGNTTLACDNINALRMAGSEDLRLPARLRQADIIRAIRHVVADLPLNLDLLHVYGHQDDRRDFADLDLPAKLNTECDLLAKQHLRHNIEQQSPAPLYFPHEYAIVTVEGKKCVSDPGPQIRNATSHYEMRDKLLARKDYLTAAAFDDTDWDAIEQAMQSYPDLYAMWVTKHAFRFCGTNQQLCRYGERKCSYCPHEGCKEAKIAESASHIMQCQDPMRRHALLESTEELDEWLTKVDTEPTLQRAIILYLRAYGWDRFGSEHRRPEMELLDLFDRQEAVGWQNFTLGRFSRALRARMEEHYKRISLTRQASTWAAGLCHCLLKLHHDQWILRNDFVHAKDEAGMTREAAQVLRDCISAEFIQGPEGLEEEDAYLFQSSYEEVIQWPSGDKRQWLLEVESARRCAAASSV